ncbi:DUF1775 domain-containing protein [Micromonospora violae]|uniref:DUF1775 domain-containing protein n=1 Tax=Micromonospora violae TaxID=1278207 RepID=UPI0033D19276
MASTYGGGRRRRIVVATAVTAAGLLLWPGAAYAADVTTTPTEARQGDAVRLEFSVPEERAGTKTTQIEVRLPADTPIAEVYPMSVNGWAPRISSRTLDQPVAGIHSSGVSTVTTAVTWVRVGASDPGPARLALSMGPMPQTDRLTFEVVQTYADGTVVRWADATGAHRAPALTLLPPAAGGAGPVGHGGHGAPAGGAPAGGAPVGGAPVAPAGPDSGGDAAPAAGAGGADEGSGNADGMLAAGLLAGLGGGAAIGWLVSRWRRRDPAQDAALAEVTGAPAEAATADGAATAAGPSAEAATLAEITGRAAKRTEPAGPTPASSTPAAPAALTPAATTPADSASSTPAASASSTPAASAASR